MIESMKHTHLPAYAISLALLMWLQECSIQGNAAEHSKDSMTLRALTIVDDKGRPRWTFEGAEPESGNPALHCLDAEGKTRISLELEGGKTPVISLDDTVGRPLLVLRIESDGNPSLWLSTAGVANRSVVLGIRPIEKVVEGYVELRRSDGLPSSGK